MALKPESLMLSALEYALYGALCAAKRETGPEGARRMYRLQERVDNWDDQEVAAALLHLLNLGWIMQQPVNEFGYVYFEAVPWR